MQEAGWFSFFIMFNFFRIANLMNRYDFQLIGQVALHFNLRKLECKFARTPALFTGDINK